MTTTHAPRQRLAEPTRLAGPDRSTSRLSTSSPHQVETGGGNQARLRKLNGRAPILLQAKLTIGAVDDPLEYEADHVADQLMRMPVPDIASGAAPVAIRRKCVACDEEEGPLRAQSAGPIGGGEAPALVHDVIRSSGQPLDRATRSFFEPRFGRDLSGIRVHVDSQAAASAALVSARAYAVGSDIVFAAGQYAPDSDSGRRLLAHELTHSVQQHGGAPQVRRFVAAETPKIALTFGDMLVQIRQLVDTATRHGQFDWDYFVEISGGFSGGRQVDAALGSKDPTIKSQLLKRYLYSCRCGLLDMRHFLQLLYISNYATAISQSESFGNRAATGKGREHELTAESASRFGAEDTPSNALGAVTNLSLPGLPDADQVFDAIKDTLTRCDPIGWSALGAASQKQIVDFYGNLVPDPAAKKAGDMIPKNQNETAVPDILPLAECGGRERSVPFDIDTSDPNRKTFDGKNFLGGSAGQTSASDMRDFITTQRPEIIAAMPLSEKIRFIKKLLSYPVRDADVAAISVIYRNSTRAELAAEP